jgi:hypothetical protein
MRRGRRSVMRRGPWQGNAACRHDIGDDGDDADDDALTAPCDFLGPAEGEPERQQEQELALRGPEPQPQAGAAAVPGPPIKPGELVEHPLQVATDFPFKQSESWSLSRWATAAGRDRARCGAAARTRQEAAQAISGSRSTWRSGITQLVQPVLALGGCLPGGSRCCRLQSKRPDAQVRLQARHMQLCAAELCSPCCWLPAQHGCAPRCCAGTSSRRWVCLLTTPTRTAQATRV